MLFPLVILGQHRINWKKHSMCARTKLRPYTPGAKWVMPGLYRLRGSREDRLGTVLLFSGQRASCVFPLGFQTVRVGTVGTPVGTVTLSCAYRINLAFMSARWGQGTRIQKDPFRDSKVFGPNSMAKLTVQLCHCSNQSPSEVENQERAQFPDGETECPTANNAEMVVYSSGCNS